CAPALQLRVALLFPPHRRLPHPPTLFPCTTLFRSTPMLAVPLLVVRCSVPLFTNVFAPRPPKSRRLESFASTTVPPAWFVNVAPIGSAHARAAVTCEAGMAFSTCQWVSSLSRPALR